MELSPFAISVLLMLTEMALAGVIGFQVYLFNHISAARREHLEFRIHVAERYVKTEHIDSALEKLEERFDKRLNDFFNNLQQRHRA
jgi:hypothetical protein